MTFNDKVADWWVNATGNMKFFWLALGFILALRIGYMPNIRELLLDIENDLQLLLLAAAAVVSKRQQDHNQKQVDHNTELLEKIEAIEEQLANNLPAAPIDYKLALQYTLKENLRRFSKAQTEQERCYQQGVCFILHELIEAPERKHRRDVEADANRQETDAEENEDKNVRPHPRRSRP